MPQRRPRIWRRATSGTGCLRSRIRREGRQGSGHWRRGGRGDGRHRRPAEGDRSIRYGFPAQGSRSHSRNAASGREHQVLWHDQGACRSARSRRLATHAAGSGDGRLDVVIGGSKEPLVWYRNFPQRLERPSTDQRHAAGARPCRRQWQPDGRLERYDVFLGPRHRLRHFHEGLERDGEPLVARLQVVVLSLPVPLLAERRPRPRPRPIADSASRPGTGVARLFQTMNFFSNRILTCVPHSFC